MSGVRILAPAKVNLGLAVLGKRADGNHEIDTIMAMIDLADVITFSETDQPGISLVGMDDVPPESNLITKAIRAWCERAGIEPAFRVHVEKHIPSPAGLGGGSSDAAAAIRAMNALFPERLSAAESHEEAALIGADCPFFLGTAAARATGTGTDLQAIPAPTGWLIMVVPAIEIAAKTASLYAALKSADYGSSRQIDMIQRQLAAGESPSPSNSFTRAAREAFPMLNLAWDSLERIAGTCTLSGTGPAVYALATREALANDWLAKLHSDLSPDCFIAQARFLEEPPAIERVS